MYCLKLIGGGINFILALIEIFLINRFTSLGQSPICADALGMFQGRPHMVAEFQCQMNLTD